MTREWVIAWVTPAEHGIHSLDTEEAIWLMVKHRERGWELPGGWIEADEPIEFAALREVFEETGLLGTARAVAEEIHADIKGAVVWVEVDEEPSPFGWASEDENIEEVGWCMVPPDELAWGREELEQIAAHDWSTARTLGS